MSIQRLSGAQEKEILEFLKENFRKKELPLAEGNEERFLPMIKERIEIIAKSIIEEVHKKRSDLERNEVDSMVRSSLYSYKYTYNCELPGREESRESFIARIISDLVADQLKDCKVGYCCLGICRSTSYDTRKRPFGNLIHMIDKNYDIEVSWLPRVNSSSPFSYTPAEGALPSEWKKACAAQQTDVQLTTAEGGVFHAHATILSLRSSYLCKLFESRFAEGVSKQIKFEESSLLVQNMLYFLYNYQLMPEIKNDPNALAETLVFATRMDVDGDMKPLVSAAACELSQLIDREIKDFESAKHLFEYAKSTKNPTLVRVLLHFVNNNMQKFSWDFVTLVVKEEWVELHAAAQEINAKEVVQELENIKKYNLEFRNYLAESNNNNNNQG